MASLCTNHTYFHWHQYPFPPKAKKKGIFAAQKWRSATGTVSTEDFRSNWGLDPFGSGRSSTVETSPKNQGWCRAHVSDLPQWAVGDCFYFSRWLSIYYASITDLFHDVYRKDLYNFTDSVEAETGTVHDRPTRRSDRSPKIARNI